MFSVNRTTKAKNPTAKAKTKRKEMTNFENGIIIAFFHCYRSTKQVSDLVCRSWSTVKSFLERACERLSIENLSRSGQSSLLSRQQRRTIIRSAKSNQKMTWSDSRDKHSPCVTLSKLELMLREVNMKEWLANTLAKLNPDHVGKRLRWAMEWRNWTPKEFGGIIWSDECSVE